MQSIRIHPASFRDPSGFVYFKENVLYRQINRSYQQDYDAFINSGLYKVLVENQLIVSHEEISNESNIAVNVYKNIKPEVIPHISYPYEWCFSQLKEAALLTLKIQKLALEHGMSLKDASAYNVQFLRGRPVFIDTLSYERYESGPWNAYRQFCQHFLAPLALKAFKDRRLGQLMRTNIDGIPLDLASHLLPWNSYFKFSLLVHIHLHAKAQERNSDISSKSSRNYMKNKTKIVKTQLLWIIKQLYSFISKLNMKRGKTEWGDYYSNTNYSTRSMEHKKELVCQFLQKSSIKPRKIIDLGANDGEFSRIATDYAETVISYDIDEVAVEKNYIQLINNREDKLLPVVQDLVNPSPAIGWANRERMSFMERGGADYILALALIHHIAITNNIPFRHIAKSLSELGDRLIIEFVPKTDSQVERMLRNREDVFSDYTQSNFEKEFSKYFIIDSRSKIKETQRTLYLMLKKT